MRRALPMIRVCNLHKHFGGLHVLRNVSFEVARGEVLVIIGPSGSGKSTLLRCMNFLEEYDSGEIWFGDKLVGYRRANGGRMIRDGEASVSRVRTRMGMVFQNFNLFPHKTVLENVIEGPIIVKRETREAAVARAEALLAKVGLSDKRDVYPGVLSGGQQQRAAIARALAINPALMLFDEPTSALDPELVGEVLRVIRALAEEGRTMILVTHEMRFAREVASHIVFLHNGCIEEEGPPEQVFGEPVSERCRQFVGAFGPR